MVEIERISVQKQCDVLNKLKLFETKQEMSELIMGFEYRLRMLAYATTKCPSQICTADNTEVILILAMVKELDIQVALLAEV